MDLGVPYSRWNGTTFSVTGELISLGESGVHGSLHAVRMRKLYQSRSKLKTRSWLTRTKQVLGLQFNKRLAFFVYTPSPFWNLLWQNLETHKKLKSSNWYLLVRQYFLFVSHKFYCSLSEPKKKLGAFLTVTKLVAWIFCFCFFFLDCKIFFIIVHKRHPRV